MRVVFVMEGSGDNNKHAIVPLSQDHPRTREAARPPAMLAYVFWHRKSDDVPQELYEKKLLSFYKTLDDSKVEGFRGAMVAKVAQAAGFVPDRGLTYEEWYVLDGSDAVDRLNDAAVSGACKAPHDEVARAAASFRAGLYQLKMGPPSNARGNWTYWLSKPRSMAYRDFYEFHAAMAERLGPERMSLWRRQMVLGPTVEFCITTSYAALEIPPTTFSPMHAIPREIIWQSARLGDAEA